VSGGIPCSVWRTPGSTRFQRHDTRYLIANEAFACYFNPGPLENAQGQVRLKFQQQEYIEYFED